MRCFVYLAVTFMIGFVTLQANGQEQESKAKELGQMGRVLHAAKLAEVQLAKISKDESLPDEVRAIASRVLEQSPNITQIDRKQILTYLKSFTIANPKRITVESVEQMATAFRHGMAARRELLAAIVHADSITSDREFATRLLLFLSSDQDCEAVAGLLASDNAEVRRAVVRALPTDVQAKSTISGDKAFTSKEVKELTQHLKKWSGERSRVVRVPSDSGR